MKNNKYELICWLIMIVGFIVRIVGIEYFPTGFNADEASAGYEAYSILKYGIDRHGNSFPIHLVAWGSGQNVLYSYLMMPFIKISGLSVFNVRIPMAIIGCISLVIFYILLKKTENKKLATIGLFFFAICPWHIMKSRWGLESNLFPDMILLAVTCLVYGVQNKKKILFYLAFVLIGLATYSYGTAYFFLPFFLITLIFFLIYKKKINIKEGIIAIAISTIIAIPLILFVVINTFDLPQIQLGVITIPRLTANRYQEIASVFSMEFIKVSFSNFVKSLKILLFQYDELPWNAMKFFGLTYIFSLPFTVIGIVECFRKDRNTENILKSIINIWFIISVILLFICEPNINRINIIMIPIIFYTVIGIYEIIKKDKKVLAFILIIYIIAMIMFMIKYITTDMSKTLTFESGLKETIEYVNKIDAEKIYMTNKIKEPYIYTLFYTQTDVNEFINTVEYATTGTNFDIVSHFGKYYFYIPEQINSEENNVYILKKEEDKQLNEKEWKKTYIKEYVIIEKVE